MLTRYTDLHVVLPDAVVRRDLLVNERGVITALLAPETPAPEPVENVSGHGAIAFPGIIDVLTHGFGHHQYLAAEPGAIAANSRALCRHGVTAFAPSIISLTADALLTTLRQLSGELHGEGARVLGLHSEGPFLGSPGAHRPENLALPTRRAAEQMLEASGGKLAFVTMGGELPGAAEFAAVMLAGGVGLHLGHTLARPDQVRGIADLGFTGVTHMYDVMFPATVVEPGAYPLSLADALLAEERLCLGLICDGVHVHPTQVKLVSLLGPKRYFLETDSMKFTGLPPGRFEFDPGRFVETTPDRACRMADGTLAGSCLTPDQGLRNLIKFAGVSLPVASQAASLNPARLAGRADTLGSLEPGKCADFALLAPDSLAVLATYVGGRRVYAR